MQAFSQNRTKVSLRYIDSEDIENKGTDLLGVDAIRCRVAFGLRTRGVEGKIKTVQFARENRFLTWVSALAWVAVEFARNVLWVGRMPAGRIRHRSQHAVSV
jgi:CTP synthase